MNCVLSLFNLVTSWTSSRLFRADGEKKKTTTASASTGKKKKKKTVQHAARSTRNGVVFIRTIFLRFLFFSSTSFSLNNRSGAWSRGHRVSINIYVPATLSCLSPQVGSVRRSICITSIQYISTAVTYSTLFFFLLFGFVFHISSL